MTATILAATLVVPSFASARAPAHVESASRHVAAAPVRPVAHTAKAEGHAKTERPAERTASRSIPAHLSEVSRSANIHHVSFSRPVADDRHASRHAAQEPKSLPRGEVRLKKSSDHSFALGRGNLKSAKARVYASRGEVLQCVPFARAASGIELKGNAVNWWDAASGIYERGHRPESGAVLNFRANSSMRLGHVAVVKHVVNSREVEIDHANWAWSGKSNITRNVAVIDVSERNDWTAVRVALGGSGDFGSVYSTYGFIYDRPDRGTVVANTSRAPFNPALHNVDEVAEAPRATLDLSFTDAPARSLR